ncbi:hypothetical protein [Actinoplanes aureus]|uniref:Uncharacterized protein n=1 Tax=Actinoplanes aureus TaxID=2792083 RepID=A0A931CMT5_9ACTN|nr:hypothetical protein [Actinoplanes aureus]MBG0567790.1 hypothetical protein [Actinoplanes aureus]
MSVAGTRIPRQWPFWAPRAAALAASALGTGVLVGWWAGYRSLAGLPGTALPGGLILLGGAIAALATFQQCGSRVPRRAVTGAIWTVAVLALAGSCWLLLNLIQLALTGKVTNADGEPAWTAFLERLALTLVGALFVATALAWRRTERCARCGLSHPRAVVDVRRPPAHAAPRRILYIAYAGCLAWLPYAGTHTLGAMGVPGVEPDGFRPTTAVLVVFWIGIGLATFLLLGLVRPWGMVFPRWTLWLAGRRVPRFLPLVPVWLIAPTFVLYGLGSIVYVVLLITGVMQLPNGETVGPLGFAQPLSFSGYGIALTIAAASYQVRTRPVGTLAVGCATPDPRGEPSDVAL